MISTAGRRFSRFSSSARLSALLLLVLCSPLNVSATLIGADVDGCLNQVGSGGCSPFVQGTWDNASAVVSDPAVEFTGTYFDLNASADLTEDTLVFSLVRAFSGTSSPVNREVSFRFTNGPIITNFVQTGGILSPSSVSFTANSISFSFTNLGVSFANNPSTAVFSVSSQAVPEPITAGMLSLGLLAAGLKRKFS